MRFSDSRRVDRGAMRTLLATVALCWTIVVLLPAAPGSAASQAGQQGAPAPAAVTPAAPRDPANPHPTAGFVGADTCIACHDTVEKSYSESPHGRAANPRTPAALHRCETCHGPG